MNFLSQLPQLRQCQKQKMWYTVCLCKALEYIRLVLFLSENITSSVLARDGSHHFTKAKSKQGIDITQTGRSHFLNKGRELR